MGWLRDKNLCGNQAYVWNNRTELNWVILILFNWSLEKYYLTRFSIVKGSFSALFVSRINGSYSYIMRLWQLSLIPWRICYRIMETIRYTLGSAFMTTSSLTTSRSSIRQDLSSVSAQRCPPQTSSSSGVGSTYEEENSLAPVVICCKVSWSATYMHV